MLPQSITQEAEEGNFVKRFGVASTADLGGRSGKVVLHQSGGAGGPDRYIRRRKIAIALVLLLVALGGAGYLYWPQLQAYLGR